MASRYNGKAKISECARNLSSATSIQMLANTATVENIMLNRASRRISFLLVFLCNASCRVGEPRRGR